MNSLVLATRAKKENKGFLVVASDLKEARSLEADVRFFSAGGVDVFLIPPIDVLPYFQLSPNPDIILDRLGFFHRLQKSTGPFIAITTLPGFLRKTLPLSVFRKHTLTLTLGDTLDLSQLSASFIAMGYARAPLVEDAGTFAIRGGIVDFFSSFHDQPVRLEFFGDQIESIKFFDPRSQKSSEKIGTAVLVPAREILFSETPEKWSGILKARADALELPKTERDRVGEFIENQIYFSGNESYIPFFYPQPGTLMDYLPDSATVVYLDEAKLHLEATHFLREQEKHHAECKSLEKIFAPTEIFLSKADWEEVMSFFPKINLDTQLATPQKLVAQISSENALKPLADLLMQRRNEGFRIALVSSSISQRERIKDLLSRYDIPLFIPESEAEEKRTVLEILEGTSATSFINLLLGNLSQGFLSPEHQQWWITESEIFGGRARVSKAKPAGEVFSSFEDLKPGDFVVHQAHGVGIYRELTRLTIPSTTLRASPITNDFILLEYQGGDKLYLPIDQLDRITRFSAAEGVAPLLDKMGGASWKKIREKVKRATRRLAAELLKIQAVRATASGFAFSPKNALYEEFEATFPFEETDDQLRAIEEVMRDMESDKPMDRLVCGDVGYGKTEVAIRAAFKAVLDHKQVAVLVPTTVLAFQHFETFKRRFADYPITLELLSRFQTPAQQKKVLEKMRKGAVDIVIATHRLLSEDISFGDLGLMIVDEEHRFGVSQKEKLKKFRNKVDVLTLTATPIPRTLNFALTGIRDLSLINTPPLDRLAIRTYLTHFDEATLRESIHHELQRGGQVFFVHNRVQTISAMKDRLQRILPDVRIGVAHGQLEEHQLEEVMLGFMEKRFDMLLATTIIESGLDIPSANTIIINRADHLGLAQLYQLRGRVGRSFHRAYCYLLVPDDELITRQAEKRLSVIQRFTELGSGFKIASHDLEIRGAGNILGAEQSGHIASIGYDLYVQLLEEAVMELRGGYAAEEIEVDLKIPVTAHIPDTMVPETNLRLALYKRLSSVKSLAECVEIRAEWQDRFGQLPVETENLIALMHIKALAKKLRITQVTVQPLALLLEIHASTPIPTDFLMEKIKREPKRWRLTPDGKLLIADAFDTEEKILSKTKKYLEELSATFSPVSR